MRYLKRFFESISDITDVIKKIKELVLLCLVDMLDSDFEISTNFSAYGEDIICVTIQNKLRNPEWSDARPGFEFDESILSLFSLLKKRYKNTSIIGFTTVRTGKSGSLFRPPNVIIHGDLPIEVYQVINKTDLYRGNDLGEYDTTTDFLKEVNRVYLTKVEIIIKV
jgi:hypothetical protein